MDQILKSEEGTKITRLRVFLQTEKNIFFWIVPETLGQIKSRGGDYNGKIPKTAA